MKSENPLGLISGSGLQQLDDFVLAERLCMDTPYGESGLIQLGVIKDTNVVFLNRHGENHTVPPHKINYRANLWALSELGVSQVIAFNTVGGIHPFCVPGSFVLPDQIIDYTWGREHTFADVLNERFQHVEFTHPFDAVLREHVSAVLASQNLPYLKRGVYGCTQGPRLETAAEIRRMAQDGCDVVGMTGMPEAGLARELNIAYAAICTVVNWGAGLSLDLISLNEIKDVMHESNVKLQTLIDHFVLDR